MDTQTFRHFSNERILQAIIEIDGHYFPTIPVKLPPFCYLAFREKGIEIIEAEPLTNKKKDVLDDLSYNQICQVEINPVKKLTVVVVAPGTRINLDLIIRLENDTHFHFECEEMSMLVELSERLTAHNIELVDPFDLVKTFSSAKTSRDAYDYLEEHLEDLAEEKQIELLRVTQTKS
ncbi:hypothetical protein I6N95_04190 [Vagococcus sp. BWB3-3]|uniref:Uncharacterized protein n=1 Tax=Vagococcus allomyrinae TaxID=2794353 RepID=A0A940P2D7_9ENTE|nr:hypothetical protein [Vagococcus allomyrinae]MBP1040207.1 hypothetical protein [Vagococcus allomyrinae]